MIKNTKPLLMRIAARAVPCFPQSKYRLKGGNRTGCCVQFPSTEGLTMEMICEEIGPPKLSARSLMESTDEKQLAQYQFQKKLIVEIAAVAMAVIIIMLITLFIYAEDHQIDHAKTTITQYIEAER